MKRSDCHDRIKAIHRSYQTVIRSVEAFTSLAISDPRLLFVNDLNLREIRKLGSTLHDAYFAKMFAAFESNLRHYWWNQVRKSKPATELLISSLARRFGVEQDTLDEVQAIRDFRNSIIHDDHQLTKAITIDKAIPHLQTFTYQLPEKW